MINIKGRIIVYSILTLVCKVLELELNKMALNQFKL